MYTLISLNALTIIYSNPKLICVIDNSNTPGNLPYKNTKTCRISGILLLTYGIEATWKP